MPRKGFHCTILTRSTHYGLGQDVRIVEQILRESTLSGNYAVQTIHYEDPVKYVGKKTDIQIHLEIPCRLAWPWAKINIVVVNPEWWPTNAWDWTFSCADIFVFKSAYARSLYPEIDDKRVRIVSWRTSLLKTPTPSFQKEFLYLLGASINKYKAANILCSAWKSSWPPILVVGSSKLISLLQDKPYSPNVRFQTFFQSDAERIASQERFGYHVVASAAEGFGYSFSECAAVGAIPLWNSLPIYQELWGGVLGSVGRIPSRPLGESSYRDTFHSFDASGVEQAVESILGLSGQEEQNLREALRRKSSERTHDFRAQWKMLVSHLGGKIRDIVPRTMPPPSIAMAELPTIAIITLTRNRPRWFPNMAKNILTCDYPFEKLTWVVADDSDAGGRVDKDIVKFQSTHPQIRVHYISLPKPMTVGAKRNKACASAPTEATVFVMMDDDDHYPSKSVATRLAWLKATKTECVYCSVLPMYDCGRYISAMNVPPLDLSPVERISEATLAFTRTFWETRGFSDYVNVGEGEGFVEDRIEKTAEIPPEGIIVSFLHGKNMTSRRVPETNEPNGCHYGFDDTYFTYLSGIAESGV